MKKICLAFVILLMALAVVSPAGAEISTNLNVTQTYENKRIKTETFVNSSGEPVMAEDLGYCTVQYTYNRKPRIVLIEYLDVDGNQVNTQMGYSAIQQDWDGLGRILSKSYFAADGSPVACPAGYHSEKTTYSGRHVLSVEHYDIYGEYVSIENELYARMEYTYDDVGYVNSIVGSRKSIR